MPVVHAVSLGRGDEAKTTQNGRSPAPSVSMKPQLFPRRVVGVAQEPRSLQGRMKVDPIANRRAFIKPPDNSHSKNAAKFARGHGFKSIVVFGQTGGGWRSSGAGHKFITQIGRVFSLGMPLIYHKTCRFSSASVQFSARFYAVKIPAEQDPNSSNAFNALALLERVWPGVPTPGGVFRIGLFGRGRCQQNCQHFSYKQLPVVRFSIVKFQLILGRTLLKYGRNRG